MKEKFGINELLKSTKSVAIFGELATLIELANRGFSVEWHGSRAKFDILINNSIKIEVKSSNRGNNWAGKQNLIGGWDRINPKKFDYLVCTSFNQNFKDIRYFIFTREETKTFPNVKWKDKRSRGLKNLDLGYDENSKKLIIISENRWDKINKL